MNTVIYDQRYLGLKAITREKAIEMFPHNLIYKNEIIGVVVAKDFLGEKIESLKDWESQHYTRKDVKYYSFEGKQSVFHPDSVIVDYKLNQLFANK